MDIASYLEMVDMFRENSRLAGENSDEAAAWSMQAEMMLELIAALQSSAHGNVPISPHPHLPPVRRPRSRSSHSLEDQPPDSSSDSPNVMTVEDRNGSPGPSFSQELEEHPVVARLRTAEVVEEGGAIEGAVEPERTEPESGLSSEPFAPPESEGSESSNDADRHSAGSHREQKRRLIVEDDESYPAPPTSSEVSEIVGRSPIYPYTPPSQPAGESRRNSLEVDTSFLEEPSPLVLRTSSRKRSSVVYESDSPVSQTGPSTSTSSLPLSSTERTSPARPLPRPPSLQELRSKQSSISINGYTENSLLSQEDEDDSSSDASSVDRYLRENAEETNLDHDSVSGDSPSEVKGPAHELPPVTPPLSHEELQERPGEVIECISCGEKPSSSFHARCGHDFCGDCLLNYVHAYIKNESMHPLQCCHETFPLDPLTASLNDSTLVDQFSLKFIEYDTAPQNRVYCANPSCSEFLHILDWEGNLIRYRALFPHKITCRICATDTCTRCKDRAHPTRECSTYNPEDDVRFAELTQERGWKTCPSCQRVIERTEGCPHMSCMCGREFCYSCGRTWHGFGSCPDD